VVLLLRYTVYVLTSGAFCSVVVVYAVYVLFVIREVAAVRDTIGTVTFTSVYNRLTGMICSTGAKFADICKLTDTFEGSIIRVLRRLEELLRQLAAASLAIGNAELKAMFEDGAKRIRRGVVFAASLYL
jgi:hypothetical protein